MLKCGYGSGFFPKWLLVFLLPIIIFTEAKVTAETSMLQEPLNRIIKEDGRTLGDANASLVIITFSDFDPGCYYCVRHFKETEPKLLKKYVNANKARYIYRDFLWKGSKVGMETAMALRCAASIGDFGSLYLGLTIAARSDRGTMHGAIQDFIRILNIQTGPNSQWSSCLNDANRIHDVQANKEDAQSMGGTGTPSFIILNTKTGESTIIPGAFPFEVFEEEIKRLMGD